MVSVLTIATILGGIAAIWFLWEKFFSVEAFEKKVNSTWWEKSQLKGKLEKNGYIFRWTDSDSVEEKSSNGYEIIFEKTLFSKHKLVNKSGQILIGKKNT